MSINTTETMLSEQIKRFLLPHTFNAAVRAGAAVMRIYEHRDDYDLSKYDGNFRSITAADRAAHEAIKRTLGQTRSPILSEDGREMHYEERCNWELFWLVDPLDGTREFIAGNNEFTINIALMENNVCAAAVIYVPYLHKIYFADRGFGSYVRDGVEPSADAAYTFDEIKQGARRLPLVAERHAHPLIAISRSHNTPETFAHVEALRRRYPDAQVIVHLDRGNLLDIYTRIFNGLKLNNTKWDIIGMSFYPDAGDWQKQTDALTDNIITLSEKYGTPCMVVETGMLRNDPGTAREYFEYLFDKMMNDTKGYCRGILYWEPETYRESGYDKGAFSDDGKPTEALEPFNMSQYE